MTTEAKATAGSTAITEPAWKHTPPPHWRLIPVFTGDSKPKFVSAEQSRDRLQIRYFWDPETETGKAHVRFGHLAQGPPGFAHGGSTAAVLDELMGVTTWEHKLAVVAAELNLRYRKPAPLMTELIATARVVSSEDRRNVMVESDLRLVDGTLLVEGSGRFVDIGANKYREYAEAARQARASLEAGDAPE